MKNLRKRHLSMELIIMLLAALLPAAARADVSDFMLGDFSFTLNHDQATGKRGASVDENVAFAFFNFGLTLRAWDGAITGWNGRQVSDEFVVYGGIGVLDFLTIQRGYSNAGARTRIRALIPLRADYPDYTDKSITGLRNYVVAITPFMETGNGKKVYGVGVVGWF